MKLFLDAMPTGAVLIDHQGKVALRNQQAELILGWTAASLEGRSAHEVFDCQIDEDATTEENCPIGRILAGSHLAPTGNMVMHCRGEVLKPVEYRCTP